MAYKKLHDENGNDIKRSRLVLKRKLGRKLESSELVHHVNGDISNDSEDNLELETRSSHTIRHIAQGDVKAYGGNRKGGIKIVCEEDSNKAWCGGCRQFKDKSLFNKRSGSWTGVDHYCKQCKSMKRKVWEKQYNQDMREYRERCKERASA